MLLDWEPCEAPNLPPTRGRFIRLDRLEPERDGPALFAAIGGDENDALWRFIPFGPFDDADSLMAVLSLVNESQEWQTLVFRDSQSGAALGMSSYMRIRPEAGSAEVGCVIFSPALQKTPAATEAMFAMARHLFDDLGYRRYEWKCDALNAPSCSAAKRLGFLPDGVWEQATVYKGRNRNTAWFSILDRDWPPMRVEFQRWLDASNFDEDGQQRTPLANRRS
jgi:RimJ/RimL family protein N-acetyltransferase